MRWDPVEIDVCVNVYLSMLLTNTYCSGLKARLRQASGEQLKPKKQRRCVSLLLDNSFKIRVVDHPMVAVGVLRHALTTMTVCS
jgi:hypothetical protein